MNPLLPTNKTMLNALHCAKNRRDTKGRLAPENNIISIIEKVIKTGQPDQYTISKYKN